MGHTGTELLCERFQPEVGGGAALTSADALLLPRQDAWAVNDADALQDLIGQLGAHEPGRKGSKVGSGAAHQSALTEEFVVSLGYWPSAKGYKCCIMGQVWEVL